MLMVTEASGSSLIAASISPGPISLRHQTGLTLSPVRSTDVPTNTTSWINDISIIKDNSTLSRIGEDVKIMKNIAQRTLAMF